MKYQLGRVCADYLLTEIGIPAAPHSGASEGLGFYTYNGLGHNVRDDELSDITSWLKKILPPSEASN